MLIGLIAEKKQSQRGTNKMKKNACFIMIICLPVSFITPAQSGGFLLAPEQKRVLVKFGRSNKPGPDSYAGYQKTQEVFLQMGLSTNWMMDAKLYEETDSGEGRHQNVHFFEAGLHRNAPILAVGLLLPYSETLLRHLFSDFEIKRNTVASVGFNVGRHDIRINIPSRHDSTELYGFKLIMADRLDIGALSMTQQVTLARREHGNDTWFNGEYKFELGWRNQYYFCNQTMFFKEAPSGYQDIQHWRSIAWQPHETDWRIGLGHGKLRRHNGGKARRRTQLEIGFSF